MDQTTFHPASNGPVDNNDPFLPSIEEAMQSDQGGPMPGPVFEETPDGWRGTFHLPLGDGITPERMAALVELMNQMGMLDGARPSDVALQMASPFQEQSGPLAYGLSLDDDAMSREEKVQRFDMVYSYIGVIPRPIDNYVGRWIKCLGAVLAPITGDVTVRGPNGQAVINQDTGEVMTRQITWTQPLFKLESIDDATQEHVILFGGGASGKRFAMNMTDLFGPGDWAEPREIFISQEQRQAVARNGQGTEPHRLYRFNSRAIKSVVDANKKGTK